MPMLDPFEFGHPKDAMAGQDNSLAILIARRRRGDFAALDVAGADGRWTEQDVRELEAASQVHPLVFRRYLAALARLERAVEETSR